VRVYEGRRGSKMNSKDRFNNLNKLVEYAYLDLEKIPIGKLKQVEAELALIALGLPVDSKKVSSTKTTKEIEGFLEGWLSSNGVSSFLEMTRGLTTAIDNVFEVYYDCGELPVTAEFEHLKVKMFIDMRIIKTERPEISALSYPANPREALAFRFIENLDREARVSKNEITAI
jgi:hypothetical protein